MSRPSQELPGQLDQVDSLATRRDSLIFWGVVIIASISSLMITAGVAGYIWQRWPA